MNETGDPSQWSPEALKAYQASADNLLKVLAKHVSRTSERTGRAKEFKKWSNSAARLTRALDAFADAEFEWCGSFPFSTNSDAESDDHEDGIEDDATGDVLSVLGRWDFIVRNDSDLIATGRSAYRETWPDDTPEDAEVRVSTAESAAEAIMHGLDVAALKEAPGLEISQATVTFVRHKGFDDFEHDPFAIAVE